MLNPLSSPEFDVLLQAPFGLVGIYTHGLQVDIIFLSEPVSVKANPSKIALQIAQQIQAYLADSKSTFNLPLMYRGTPFQRKVWSAIAAIPHGQTRTYGALAKELGSGARAVANACGANHIPFIVPCHRVVAKQGLGGFMQGADGGASIKQWLLHHEGALNHKGQFF